jgi:hypothetical protein
MGVKNTDRRQLGVLSDHFKDNLDVFGVPDTHGIINTCFYSAQEKIRVFSCRIYQLHLFFFEVQECKKTDPERQQNYRYEDDTRCEAAKYQSSTL